MEETGESGQKAKTCSYKMIKCWVCNVLCGDYNKNIIWYTFKLLRGWILKLLTTHTHTNATYVKWWLCGCVDSPCCGNHFIIYTYIKSSHGILNYIILLVNYIFIKLEKGLTSKPFLDIDTSNLSIAHKFFLLFISKHATFKKNVQIKYWWWCA